MKKVAALIVLGLFVGTAYQSYTGWMPFSLEKVEIYSKPTEFSVSRYQNVIRHRALGEKLSTCKIISPVIAELKDSNGHVKGSELVRYFSRQNDLDKLSSVIKQAINEQTNLVQSRDLNYKTSDNITNFVSIEDLKTTDSSYINFSNIPPEPRKFEANQFFIVTTKTALEKADRFEVKVDCVNPTLGRVTGRFGPFPIPPDGVTYTHNSPEANLKNSVPWFDIITQGTILLLLIFLIIV
jgi:hypothetical protein